ncbi:MAG: bifunctional hydroxymethylpyrimidine kinase/phosphomethylpyrimidine kinase [Ruthenibacterium sp.]
MRPKRVLCIQDISCVGRCSLTVMLPALSAMGLQACPLPTALLSTHPSGFTAPVRTDETAFCRSALDAYDAQGIKFDAILSGFLASPAQADLVEKALRQNPAALKLIDPVMADGGRLYSGTTPALCDALRALCRHADVLTPNVTESAMLLNLPPDDAPMDSAALTARICALHAAYPLTRCLVITGVHHTDGRSGNALLCANGENTVDPAASLCSFGDENAAADFSIWFFPYEAVPQSYPGTGDLFAAVLAGGLLMHGDARRSVQDAAAFVSSVASYTLQSGGEPRFGVQLEPLLRQLCPPVPLP